MSDFPNDLDVGTTVHLTAALTDGTLLVDGTVSLTVTAPDGTSQTPPVVHDGTGNYSSDLVVTASGVWTYSWISSGPVSVKNGYFTVRDPLSANPGFIISALDVSNMVNKQFTSDEADFVNWLIGLLQGSMELRLNRQLSVRALTEYHMLPRDLTSKVYLYQTPVVSVQSIVVTTSDSLLTVPSAYTLDPSGYLWTDFGEVSLLADLTLDYDWFAIGEALVKISYTAGVDGLNYPGLKNLLLGACSREYLIRARGVQGLSSISVEGSSWSFGKSGFSSSGGKGGGGGGNPTFTDDELLGISRLKKRVVAY